jgi:hypothetical protein
MVVLGGCRCCPTKMVVLEQKADEEEAEGDGGRSLRKDRRRWRVFGQSPATVTEGGNGGVESCRSWFVGDRNHEEGCWPENSRSGECLLGVPMTEHNVSGGELRMRL